MSIFKRPRPGVLPVSPPDEPEMPDEYTDKARAELRADLEWVAEKIAEAIDQSDAALILDDESSDDKDLLFCDRMRSVISAAVEREAPDLAEKLWREEIESSQQDAAEYAADCADY